MGDASNVICSDMQHVTTSLTDMSRWQYVYDLYDPMYIVYSTYIYIYTHHCKYTLIGGIPTPLKNMKVSWDYYAQYMDK